MNRKLIKFSTFSALALSLVMWGCDSLSESALTGPSEKSEVLVTYTSSSGYTVARETDASVGTVTALIGPAGGALSIGKHFLSVPAGAVDAPTTFTMVKEPGSLKVDLTATRLLPNDVGHAGFPVPVKLGLSYESAESVPNPGALKVIWLKTDGTFEVQSSSVDVYGKLVVGSVNHFSAFAIAIPE